MKIKTENDNGVRYEICECKDDYEFDTNEKKCVPEKDDDDDHDYPHKDDDTHYTS